MLLLFQWRTFGFPHKNSWHHRSYLWVTEIFISKLSYRKLCSRLKFCKLCFRFAAEASILRYFNIFGSLSVWPDWAIYLTLGNFSKPLATINLPKSPTFLGNFYKGVKIFNFSSEIIFGRATFKDIWRFFLVTLVSMSMDTWSSNFPAWFLT